MFYKVIRAIVKVILKFIYKIEVVGKENIRLEGNLVLSSNHTHILDPVVLAVIFPRQVHFMAKQELFKNKVLSYIFTKLGAFPINREETDLSAIRMALKVLKQDKVLGIFPEGTRVKEFDLNNVKAGTALLSVRSKSPVQPIYIEGSYKIFSKIKVYIGEVIEFDEYYEKRLNNEEYTRLSEEILRTIYSTKAN